MAIYRCDMTIPVRVVSVLYSDGVDEAPERPITDEDGRTVQPNAFVRNGLDEAILPGRSIKGAIRAALEEHMNELGFSEEELRSLWGGEMRREVSTHKKQRGDGTDESLALQASALTFHHAVVWDRTRGDLLHRMSTATDRTTGGAADGALFAYEYLPVDTTFGIYVSVEVQDPTREPPGDKDAQSTTPSKETKGTSPASPALVEKTLRAIVTLLGGEFISLGDRIGSGQGAVGPRQKKVSCKKVAILSEQVGNNEPTDFLSVVFSQFEPLKFKSDSKLTGNHSSTSIRTEWQAPSRLLIGMNKPDGIKPSEEDTVPAAPLCNWHLNDTHHADHGDATYPKVVHEDKASLLLPSMSIRGALRPHCPRIARSIASDSEGSDELTMAEDVHKQLAADPLLVRYLFGTTKYRGAIRIHDCEGQVPEDMGKDKPLKLTRNAIDRVTGSAAHGALCPELLYPHATWGPTEIETDYTQLCWNICQDPGSCVLSTMSASDQECKRPAIKSRLRAATLFLTMAVTDPCEGAFPLRGGTGGGFGFIEASCVRVNGLPDDTSPVEILFEAADHSENSCEVREARANLARDILTRILTASAEDGDEATSAE